MTRESILYAVEEAQKFIRRARAVTRTSEDNRAVWPPKESGALRRSSLDLTRALADMRRPQ